MRWAARHEHAVPGCRGREAVHARLRVEADQFAERGDQVVLGGGAQRGAEREAVHVEIGVAQRRRGGPHLVGGVIVVGPVVRVVLGIGAGHIFGGEQHVRPPEALQQPSQIRPRPEQFDGVARNRHDPPVGVAHRRRHHR